MIGRRDATNLLAFLRRSASCIGGQIFYRGDCWPRACRIRGFATADGVAERMVALDPGIFDNALVQCGSGSGDRGGGVRGGADALLHSGDCLNDRAGTANEIPRVSMNHLKRIKQRETLLPPHFPTPPLLPPDTPLPTSPLPLIYFPQAPPP